MPRSHISSKLGIAMTGGLIMSAALLLVYCIHGTLVVSSATSGAANAKATVTAEPADDTLQLLHVVFRHGPRTPADTYPNDPHINQTFFPYGWGHLTNDGKRELFNVGRWLHERYNEFLGPFYYPDLLYAQSTGIARTHMSMQMVLASMFAPDNTVMSWNDNINWQPIPIYSQPLDKDTLLLVRTPCPRYFEALDEVLQLPEVRHEIEPYEIMFRELSELTGLHITSPEDIQSLYTTLLAEQEYGLKLPTWTKHYYPERMQFLTEQSYIYNIYTREMQKIKAGPFLRKMFGEWQEYRNDMLKPGQRKLFMYAGHDSTVVNIMSALNLWQRQLPRYSIMVLFELHKHPNTDDYYIQVYMRNSGGDAGAPIQPLIIPGCDFQCPLEQLYALTANVIPSDHDTQLCDSRDIDFDSPPLRGP